MNNDTTPSHWLDDSSPLSKLAKLCKMSVPTLRDALPMKIPLKDLKTLDDAETARHFGCIKEPVWREFCYRWRDEAFRFSDLGKREAARHAEEHGLKLPSSDRFVAKSDAEARAENYREYQRGLPAWARGPG